MQGRFTDCTGKWVPERFWDLEFLGSCVSQSSKSNYYLLYIWQLVMSPREPQEVDNLGCTEKGCIKSLEECMSVWNFVPFALRGENVAF